MVFGLLFFHIFCPVDKPVGHTGKYDKCLFIACVFIRIEKSHEELVDRILRRPDIDILRHNLKVFFRYGTGPFSAVFKLASAELAYYMTKLSVEQLIFFVCDNGGCGRQVMSQKMPPQLAGGCFPSPVKICLFGIAYCHHPRDYDARFEIIIL